MYRLFFFLAAQYDNQINTSHTHRPSQSKKVSVGVARQGHHHAAFTHRHNGWAILQLWPSSAVRQARQQLSIFTLQGRVCPRPARLLRLAGAEVTDVDSLNLSHHNLIGKKWFAFYVGGCGYMGKDLIRYCGFSEPPWVRHKPKIRGESSSGLLKKNNGEDKVWPSSK